MSLRFFEIVVYKALNIAVHYSLNVARFVTGAMIFDECIRTENVTANLAAPFYLLDFALYILVALHSFFFALFRQLAYKHTHSHLAILRLASFVLTGNDYTRRKMRYPYCGIRFIDMLTARAAAAEGIYP